ncbi:hypothetical protein DN062_06210 [Nitrincola tibetensis]|uniref:Energy-coupling factor ABC transporter permease n=1 Tax=Nitrincola tibetensis TaxID=2219697 RepID=A0A364NPQ1_9GAMM|nr:energy-coupling factor ABC transporter permease [Nitrincola tibetensis]RAU19061.1 hypothetical protein DN062_06210 [Nitrincola tibetensis]
MSVSDGLLSLVWVWSATAIYVLILARVCMSLPWRIFMRERGIQHMFFGAVLVLVLMWQMRAGVSAGLTVHFLGMTTLTLILGWDFAVLAGSLAMLVMTLLGIESGSSLPVSLICVVVLPVLVTVLVLRVAEAKLPRNFFVYMFVCAFFGAGLAVAVSGMSMAMLLWLDGVYSWSEIYHNYAMYLPLIMMPEGLLNGIIMTGIMVFHPDWIRTFDARVYIDEQ